MILDVTIVKYRFSAYELMAVLSRTRSIFAKLHKSDDTNCLPLENRVIVIIRSKITKGIVLEITVPSF